MRGSDRTTRRRVLRATAGVGIAAFLAGCGDGGNGNGNGDETDEEPAGGDGEDPAGGNGEEPADENGEEPAGEEDTEDGGGDGAAIEPDTRIVLDAQTAGWVGVEPEDIADEENPTITLTEGESYEIGWEEGDGSEHNIEIRDDSDEVVDDLETDPATEGGDDQFLEFDASSEMTQYVCEPHETTMVGDLEIESNGGGGGEGEGEDEGDGTEDENGTGDGEDGENGAEDGNGEDENGQ